MTANPHPAEQSLLDRFAHAIAQIARDERPDVLTRPITVAELYQDVAPYRRMRELAGIEMHADYEHALIRLLAGEGGFAQLDPETAAAALAVEAEAPDPDLSAYRKYAACDVRLTLAAPAGRARPLPAAEPSPALRRAEPEPAPAARRSEPEPTAAHRPPAESAPRRKQPDARGADSLLDLLAGPLVSEPAKRGPSPKAAPTPKPGAGPQATPGRPAASETGVAVRCAFCGQGLPAGREVHFCPFCGGDQSALRCGACGETLEQGWRFCVACGGAAGD